MPRQNVRCVRPKIAPVIPAHLPLRQLRRIRRQLLLRLPPREIRVALTEPDLPQHLHHLRLRKRLRQKQHIRIHPLHRPDQFLPKRHRFRMRIVHPENLHPAPHPIQHHLDQFLPKVLPIRAVKVQRINVLILLRRILRIPDRSIRPLIKPIRMRLHIRMIRRAIQRKIQRDLHPSLLRLSQQPHKIRLRPQRRLDRQMPPGRSPNRPRRSHIAQLCHQRVVLPLPMRHPDRMNRRKVNHIKPHRLRIIQPRHTIPKRRVLVRPSLRIAREKLIPRRKPRPLPLHLRLHHHRRRRLRPIRKPIHQRLQLRRKQHFQQLLRRQRPQQLRAIPQLHRRILCTRSLRPLRRFQQQPRPLPRLNPRIRILRLHPHRKRLLPRPKHIPPRLHRILPPPGALKLTAPVPTIPIHLLQSRFRPPPRPLFPVLQHRAHHVMPILEHIHPHLQNLAHNAFNRVPPTFQARVKILDDDGRGVSRGRHQASTLK